MEPDLRGHHDQRAIVVEPGEKRNDQIALGQRGWLSGLAPNQFSIGNCASKVQPQKLMALTPSEHLTKNALVQAGGAN